LKNFAKKNRKKRAGVDHTSNQAVPGPTNGGHFNRLPAGHPLRALSDQTYA
jgi:hypothetical protein